MSRRWGPPTTTQGHPLFTLDRVVPSEPPESKDVFFFFLLPFDEICVFVLFMRIQLSVSVPRGWTKTKDLAQDNENHFRPSGLSVSAPKAVSAYSWLPSSSLGDRPPAQEEHM